MSVVWTKLGGAERNVSCVDDDFTPFLSLITGLQNLHTSIDPVFKLVLTYSCTAPSMTLCQVTALFLFFESIIQKIWKIFFWYWIVGTSGNHDSLFVFLVHHFGAGYQTGLVKHRMVFLEYFLSDSSCSGQNISSSLQCKVCGRLLLYRKPSNCFFRPEFCVEFNISPICHLIANSLAYNVALSSKTYLEYVLYLKICIIS